jgi:hypothetical protein
MVDQETCDSNDKSNSDKTDLDSLRHGVVGIRFHDLRSAVVDHSQFYGEADWASKGSREARY